MLDIVHARIARDLTDQQFAAGPRRAPRTARATATTPRAPVRRGTARVLRGVADLLEPAPRSVRA